MSSDAETSVHNQDLDSEDEMDWEEVNVPAHPQAEPQWQDIDVNLGPVASAKKGKGKEDTKKKAGITHEERLMRINVHKSHTVVLLANAKIRNQWINDETLQARLMSLTPINLQNEFAQIHPSRYPDQGQRGRLFERAMQHLVGWWSQQFFQVLPTGHIRNRTFDEVQSKLETFGVLYDENELDDDTLEGILSTEIERIRGPKSLMKHALNREGSRDVSAQLFTSLCRALGVPARLVVSLQSVPWQPSVGKPKPMYTRKDAKGKAKAKETTTTSTNAKGSGSTTSDGAPAQMSEKARGKQRAEPVIKLRKQKDKGHRLDAPTPSSSRLSSPDPTLTPPIFWTEVFSRPDARWMPVDPIRGLVNKRKAFDPTPTPTYTVPGTQPANTGSLLPSRPQPKPSNYYSALPKGVKQENRLLYVMAFEEDGYARDVTRRYAREYNAKIAKHQGGSNATNSGGKAREVWWETVCGLVRRPFRLHRDDMEDDELVSNQMSEGMPSTIAGFKDHPLYVLTRHLKQNEVIHPPPPDTPEIGKFRGEPVYPRSSLVPLKSAETWMRQEGRIVKVGEQPLKTIKARPGTLNRQREVEVMKDELRDAGRCVEGMEMTQGLYARAQTEVYVPMPIVDGKIPKNDFGNIDLYTPTMLPRGAAHIPFKGTAKMAKRLGFDYAEAVTGFEFRKRRANPVVEGIVVAAENEGAILEAFWEQQRIDDEKARKKKEERALKNWILLIKGLRIRQQLVAEYGDYHAASSSKTEAKKVAKAKAKKPEAVDEDQYASSSEAGELGYQDVPDAADDDEGEGETMSNRPSGPGGFIDADDVVERFHLPKFDPLILASSKENFILGGGKRMQREAEARARKLVELDEDEQARYDEIDYETYDLEGVEGSEEPPVSEYGTLDMDDSMEVDGVEEGGGGGDGKGREPLALGELAEAEGMSTKRISMQEMVEAESTAGQTAKAVTGAEHTVSVTEGGRKLRLRLPPASSASKAGSSSASARPTRSVSARKRKRDVEEENEESDEGHAEAGTIDTGDADEDDAEDEDAVVDDDEEDGAYGSRKPKAKSKAKRAPRKKARGGAAASPAKPRAPRATKAKVAKVPIVPATPAPTDRVLRSRRPKVSA